MGNSTPIKIIKKKELEQRSEDAAKDRKARNPQQTTRDLVSTVSDWVNEFQQKRRTETKMALKTLLADHPRPSET